MIYLLVKLLNSLLKYKIHKIKNEKKINKKKYNITIKNLDFN